MIIRERILDMCLGSSTKTLLRHIFCITPEDKS